MKKVSFGFNSTIVRPSPVLARNFPDANLDRLAFKALPHGGGWPWTDWR